MTDSLKICILIASLEQGGAQRMALRLFDGFDRLGYDVHFITIDGTHEVCLHNDPARSRQLAQRVRRLSSCNVRRNTPAKIITAPVQWRRLHRCLRELQSDVVISFMERANIFSLISLPGVYRIICIRTQLSMAMRQKSWLKERLIRCFYPLLLRRADNINFNSEGARKDFLNLFPAAIPTTSVIHNYCDIELINRLAEAPVEENFRHIFACCPVIITSGRLLPVKGHQYLIRAFKKLNDTAKDITPHLIILGEGPSRRNLTELISDFQLENQVHLPGFQKNPYAWIGRSDIFVLPSLHEGFPNSLLEAMALGIPAIATACPSGPVELLCETFPARSGISTTNIVYGEYGILVPPLDGQEKVAGKNTGESENAEDFLYLALHQLLHDPEKRDFYQKQGRKKAESLSFETFFDKWQNLLPLTSTHNRRR